MPGIIQNTFNQALMMGAAASAGIDYMKKQYTPEIEAFNAEVNPQLKQLKQEGNELSGAQKAIEGQASMLPLKEDVRDADRVAYETAVRELNKREQLLNQQKTDWQQRVEIIRGRVNDINKKTHGWAGHFDIPSIGGNN